MDLKRKRRYGFCGAGRRVRRKRARSLSGKGGLGEKGWTVRYDYKMGFMAEMRREIEVSLKCVVTHPFDLLLRSRDPHRHYEDCYGTLLEMFPQPTLLTPRTKRWAEAKVLADCLTVKVCSSSTNCDDAYPAFRFPSSTSISASPQDPSLNSTVTSPSSDL